MPDSVLATMNDASRRAPLAPEPFLVRGVKAELAGDLGLSTRAFLAAEKRDPRSLPAHYFLAERFFRSGNAHGGLQEVAALARLAPAGVNNLAPYIAAYAKDKATWPELRAMLAGNPDLASVALATLAADPVNADAIVALATAQQRDPGAAWVPRLLGGLVSAGQYSRAHAIWSQIARRPPAATVYDPGFADAEAPPPFNWELMSSNVGTAERQSGGRLHVIFYGQQDGLLARQLLVLRAGRYRVTLAASGQSAGVNWSLRCDRTQAPFTAIASKVIASRAWTFTVPQDCPAQWLELSGVSSDEAEQSDFTISRFEMTAERPNG